MNLVILVLVLLVATIAAVATYILLKNPKENANNQKSKDQLESSVQIQVEDPKEASIKEFRVLDPDLFEDNPTKIHVGLSAKMPAFEEKSEEEEVSSVSADTLAGTWTLRFVHGDFDCPDFSLSKARNQIGRRSICDMQILDNGISKQHADLILTKEGLVVFDLRSVNGTWLNDVLVRPEKATKLKSGDRIAFSTFIFEVLYKESTPES